MTRSALRAARRAVRGGGSGFAGQAAVAGCRRLVPRGGPAGPPLVDLDQAGLEQFQAVDLAAAPRPVVLRASPRVWLRGLSERGDGFDHVMGAVRARRGRMALIQTRAGRPR
jgi:hypothetical protein